MKQRKLVLVLFCLGIVMCYGVSAQAECYTDTVNLDSNKGYSWNHLWTHCISGLPDNFSADSAEITIKAKVWYWGQYPYEQDVVMSNTAIFNYSDGYVCSLDTGTHPNPSTFYPITCDVKNSQLLWVNDDGCVNVMMVTFLGTYYLDSSTLETCDSSPVPAVHYYCDNDDDSHISLAISDTCYGTGCEPTECQTVPGSDCNDNNDTVYPGASELCDNEDNDCDGTVDEDFPGLSSACTAGLGVCEASGLTICTQDNLGVECNAVPGNPTEDPEATCNDGFDNDCDGDTDGDDSDCSACYTYDLDCDNDVDIVDVMLVAARWNTRSGEPNYDALCDLDNDGDIDIVDVMMVAAQWGWQK